MRLPISLEGSYGHQQAANAIIHQASQLVLGQHSLCKVPSKGSCNGGYGKHTHLDFNATRNLKTNFLTRYTQSWGSLHSGYIPFVKKSQNNYRIISHHSQLTASSITQTDCATLKDLSLLSKTLCWESTLCHFILRETIEKVWVCKENSNEGHHLGNKKGTIRVCKKHVTYLKVGQIGHQWPKAQRRLKEQYKLVTSRRLSHFNVTLGEIRQKKCCCCELMSLWEIVLSEQPSAISAMSWLSRSPFHLQWAPETLSGTKSQERVSLANKTPVQVTSQFLSLFT